MAKIYRFCCHRLLILLSGLIWAGISFSGYAASVVSSPVSLTIDRTVDLKGDTLRLHDGVNLVFRKGGYLRNGTLVGCNSRIIAGEVLIFKDIRISGTWDNHTVYSNWFDFRQDEDIDNSLLFRDLMSLCRGDSKTDLYMQEGRFHISAVSNSANIRVPSNVHWHNKATICLMPTELTHYSIVEICKENNIVIDGGVFIGDLVHHKGTKGEWGHGIACKGAENVTIKNVICRECWGDGIDLVEGEYSSLTRTGTGNCRDIKLIRVNCLYNRRQGLSIEAAENVVVTDSEFAYTGRLGMTEPGAGIDIEPWCKNGLKINNILIQNCRVHSNLGTRDFACQPNLMYYDRNGNPADAPENGILVSDCRIGVLSVLWANGVEFRNCIVSELNRFSFVSDVSFIGCRINNNNSGASL